MNGHERVPPSDITAEACTLGSMIHDRAVVPRVCEIVDVEDFFRPAHQLLFPVLVDLASDDRLRTRFIDLVVIRDELHRRGLSQSIGGMEYIDELLQIPSADNAEYYAGIVAEKARLRRLIVLAGRIADGAYDHRADSAEIVEATQQALATMGRRDVSTAEGDLADAALEVIAHAREVAAGTATSGLPTGFAQIDEPTGGLKRGQLWTLAGATSLGKTGLACEIAGHAAGNGGAVLVVSAEMTRCEIAQRFLQAKARVSGSRIDAGKMTPEEWAALDNTAAEFGRWHLRIRGMPATAAAIRAMAVRLALEWRRPLDLIVVDYLQIMIPPRDMPARANRESQVNAIARELKQAAAELDVPILMLSQLSRYFQRDNRPPELSDLRESGAIEQHSNVVLLLHRPPAEHLQVSPGGEHTIWAKVAKCRSGAVTRWPDPPDTRATIALRFVPTITSFRGAEYAPGQAIAGGAV